MQTNTRDFAMKYDFPLLARSFQYIYKFSHQYKIQSGLRLITQKWFFKTAHSLFSEKYSSPPYVIVVGREITINL